VLQQAEIIVGHAFVTHQGKKRGLIDAVVQHTRHLNDFPIQWTLIVLAAVGAVTLLVRRIWWPLAVWFLLVAAIVHSSAPFGGPIGWLTGKFSDLFYSDPRRLSAVVTMLLTAAAGIGVFTLVSAVVSGVRRRVGRGSPRVWHAVTAVALAVVSIVAAWHYFPRHRFLLGDKYDSVLVDKKDLDAWAYLATLPLRLSGSAGAGLSPLHLVGVRRRRGPRSTRCRGGRGAQHPLRGDQHTGGPRVRDARRTSVARYVAVVGEDLRQRRGPHL
jgi:hypothetical protein